ncbi:MAG TPA: hypothetical protein VFB72_18255 [Verrucomicrobiae bacterium]|nr:hypothetical protein [Verrucomicrobiae bacterium]
MKKTKIALLSGIFLLGTLVNHANAIPISGTAPGAINGTAFLIHAVTGTGTLTNSGYYLLLPANSSLTYDLIGSGSISNSTGTYAYSATNAFGTIAFSDSDLGSGTNSLTFFTDSSGDSSVVAGTNTQFGTFEFAAGQAPASIANHSYYINIANGTPPFASSGTVIFSVAPSGTNYNVFPTSGGISSSSGTITNSAVTNTSTAVFCLADSSSGNSTEYFSFKNASNGIYLVAEDSGGGYQTGSFTVSNLMPTLFFQGQVDLSPDWDWLKFPDGTNFGYYTVMDFGFPLFYHLDMGFEWYFDANNNAHGAYLYDFSSQTFFYTDPQTFPFLYDFTLNTWLYWFPDTNNPGRYTSKPRVFWDFATGSSITK